MIASKKGSVELQNMDAKLEEPESPLKLAHQDDILGSAINS